MAENLDWDEILNDRYTTFKIEETAFAESLKIANSTEVSAEKIYEAIQDDPDVPENLKLIYREAVYGDNECAKSRIKNRISNMRRSQRYA